MVYNAIATYYIDVTKLKQLAVLHNTYINSTNSTYPNRFYLVIHRLTLWTNDFLSYLFLILNHFCFQGTPSWMRIIWQCWWQHWTHFLITALKLIRSKVNNSAPPPIGAQLPLSCSTLRIIVHLKFCIWYHPRNSRIPIFKSEGFHKTRWRIIGVWYFRIFQ